MLIVAQRSFECSAAWTALLICAGVGPTAVAAAASNGTSMERKITRRDESPQSRPSFGTPTRSLRAPQSTLRSLNHQVNNSQISLTIEARSAAGVGGGGCTIGKAARDAGRVLTVAAPPPDRACGPGTAGSGRGARVVDRRGGPAPPPRAGAGSGLSGARGNARVPVWELFNLPNGHRERWIVSIGAYAALKLAIGGCARRIVR